MRPANRRMTAMLMCVVLAGAGCGSITGSQSMQPEIPLPNRTLAAQAVVAALDQLPVTTEPGTAVALFIEDTGDTAAVTREAVTSVLGRYGITTSDDPSGIPRLTVRVDSLSVKLMDRYTGVFRREITRTASAAVTMVWTGQAGQSELYAGAGIARDRLLSGGTLPDDTSEPFVYVETIGHPVRTLLKPAGLLVTMTAFLWTLYSYRG